MTGLDKLKGFDGLRSIPFEKCECYVHDEHRWVLPIIFDAQERQVLPRPCILVMFDAHDDALSPSCMDKITKMKEDGFDIEDIISLCENSLSGNNDDWVRSGMELGLIAGTVIFGVEKSKEHDPYNYRPEFNNMPDLKFLGHPGSALEYQGVLVDHTKANCCSELRAMLEWSPNRGFSPVTDDNRILLDFDLDCFIVRYRLGRYKFPWPDEVFEGEYPEESKAKGFMDELINRAGLITIAREPVHCGGAAKSDQVLHKVNRFFFDDELSID